MYVCVCVCVCVPYRVQAQRRARLVEGIFPVPDARGIVKVGTHAQTLGVEKRERVGGEREEVPVPGVTAPVELLVLRVRWTVRGSCCAPCAVCMCNKTCASYARESIRSNR